MPTGLAVAAGVLLCAVHSARAEQRPASIGSIPIAVSVADLAAAAGVHRVDPSTLPLDIVRNAFAAPDGASAPEARIRAAIAGALGRDGAAAGLIPLPLGPKLWAQRVLGRSVPDGRLAAAIFAARPAALLYHGLMGIEPATLTWIEANPAILDTLRQHPGVSAVYARSIRIRNGRVVTPGDAADDVWAAIVGADPDQPAAFVKKLLSARSGRLAALYDAVAHLDPPRQAFAIGKAGQSGRSERAKRLLDAVTRQDPRWKLEEYPFMRSDVDETLLLRAARVTDSGELAPPASRAVWSRLFGGADDGGAIDAGSLVEMILLGGDRTARQRLDLFLFGQRALGSDDRAATAALVEALEGFRRYPALMLTLETYGLGAAEYAAAARAAAALGEDNDAVAVFQSGIAIVDRARRSRTIDASRARAAIASLTAAASEGSRGSLIAWVRDGLVEPLRLAVADGVALGPDAVVLAAMAGPRGSPGPIIAWEGQQFRADPSGAELRRLSAIRRSQGELPLDDALAASTPRNLTGLARSLSSIVYADALGDPAGQPGGAGQVWRRHRFDGNEAGQPGQPVAWRAAREVFAGDGWHMVGSLLRLDLALAPLALRRLDSTEMPMPSVLSTSLRRTLALSVALIDPRALTDDQRDAAAAAIARGRARAAGVSKDPGALDAAADAAGLSEWRRNGVRWTLSTDPARAHEGFTLLELFRIGGGDAHAAWGAAWTPIDGCLCLRFPDRGAWEELSGRPSSGLLATQLPDVMLRTAEALSTRRLPAVLTRDVAAFAMQEVLDRARPVYLDDWLPVALAARDLRDEQFDDYVAALTVAGPLVPVRQSVR